MKKVYRQRSNGALWVVSNGEFGKPVGLDGTRYLLLTPVHRLQAAGTREPIEVVDRPEMYALLNKHYCHELVVTKAEFEAQFELDASLVNKSNDPIDELMAEYEAECCDHNDVPWLVRASYRYVDSMQDSQVRCLLYAMARKLDTVVSDVPAKAE